MRIPLLRPAATAAATAAAPLLLLLFLLGPALTSAVIVCERESAPISCPMPGTSILVTSAVYGRTSSPEPSCGRTNPASLATTSCRDSGAALVALSDLCNTETDCDVSAVNAAFGDPCAGIVKYLNFTFDCVDEDDVEGEVVAASACERTEFFASCPSGLVLDVLFANYGRRPETDTCGRTPSEIPDTSCFDFDAITVVRDACQGEAQCSLTVDNDAFNGDPCPNTVKALEVEYQCVEPEDTSGPLIPPGTERVCETETLSLSCPDGEFIDIEDATFGRSSLVPDCGRSLASINNTDCGRMGNLKEPLQLRCNGLSSCEVDVSVEALGIGDPCPTFVKYLEVKSSCSPDAVPIMPVSTPSDEPLNPPSSVVVEEAVCERLSVTAECLPGTFINVLSATFGRRGLEPDCMRGAVDNPECGRDDNVINQVSELCNSKESCEVEVAIDTFGIGDPCPGTVKVLLLDYSCDGVPPPTAPEAPDGDDQICEGDEPQSIACPAGRVIEVMDATFGRSSLVPSCDRRIDQINNTDCGRVNNFQEFFMDLCDGQESCEFVVSVDALDLDPCPSISKYLDIQYACTEGGVTDPTQTTTPGNGDCAGDLRVDLLDVFENFGSLGVALNLFVENLPAGQQAGTVIELAFPRYCSRLPPPQGGEWAADFEDTTPYEIVATTTVASSGFGFAMVGTESGPCYPRAASVDGVSVCSIDTPPVVTPPPLDEDETPAPTFSAELCRASLDIKYLDDGSAVEFSLSGLVGGAPAGTIVSFNLGPGCEKGSVEWNADFVLDGNIVTAETTEDNSGFGFSVTVTDEAACFPGLATINGLEECGIMRPSLETTDAPATTAAPLPTPVPGERGSLTEEICSGDRLALACFGNSVLRIVSATFGRRSTSPACGGPVTDTFACPDASTSALDSLSSRCNGEPLCRVPDVDELTEESCAGNAAFEVTYDCLVLVPVLPIETEGPPANSDPESTDGPLEPPTSAADVQICEREEVTLDCGTGVIEVDSVFYGRKVMGPTCDKEEVSLQDTNCSLPGVLAPVQAECDGRVSCTFEASNDFFGGDPCSTTFKYTEIEFSCGSAPVEGGMDTLCERETLEIDCGLQPILIESVFFGRDSKTPDCGKQPVSLMNTDCSSTTADAAVKAACTGLSSCSVPVSITDLGGDPCPGTSKYLKVDYECGEPEDIPSSGSVEVCEQEPLLITCGADVIDVKSVSFGRGPDSDDCGFSGTSLEDTRCSAPDAAEVVMSACQLQSTCSLNVNVNLFDKDPCSGTKKVLAVDWECVPAVDKDGCPLPVELTTCEKSDFVADCPTGTVIEMKSAFYGRDDETTCSRGPATVTDTECVTEGALSIVSDLCNGDNSCSFPVDSSTFPMDACVGTVKYLTAEYFCVKPSVGLPAGC